MAKFDYKKWIIEQKALRGAPNKRSNISKGPKGPKGPKNPTKFSPIDNPGGNSIQAPLATCTQNGIQLANCHRWKECDTTNERVYLDDTTLNVVGPGTFQIDSSLPLGTIIRISSVAQGVTHYRNIEYMGSGVNSNVAMLDQTQYLGYLCDCDDTSNGHLQLISGCMDSQADNHNPNATCPCLTCCTYPNPIDGCMDPTADNYDALLNANTEDGSCKWYGCTDSTAQNPTNFPPSAYTYNTTYPSAIVDDGSCNYTPSGSPCWNVTFQECVATQTPGQQGNYTACITIGGSQPNTTTNSKFRIVHSGNYQAGPGTPSYVNPYGYTDYKITSAESTPTYTSNPDNYPVGTCNNRRPRDPFHAEKNENYINEIYKLIELSKKYKRKKY